jgi:hypothetical protein
MAVTPEATIATTAMKRSIPMSVTPPNGLETPIVVRVNNAATVPTMKTSECAKLMSRSTP